MIGVSGSRIRRYVAIAVGYIAIFKGLHLFHFRFQLAYSGMEAVCKGGSFIFCMKYLSYLINVFEQCVKLGSLLAGVKDIRIDTQ